MANRASPTARHESLSSRAQRSEHVRKETRVVPLEMLDLSCKFVVAQFANCLGLKLLRFAFPLYKNASTATAVTYVPVKKLISYLKNKKLCTE